MDECTGRSLNQALKNGAEYSPENVHLVYPESNSSPTDLPMAPR